MRGRASRAGRCASASGLIRARTTPTWSSAFSRRRTSSCDSAPGRNACTSPAATLPAASPRARSEGYPDVPVALHQDHGNSPETCFSAIEQGFTSVMMDGSLLADGKTPSDFEYNVEVTRAVVERAHALGVTVEGELGTLGGIEDGHGVGKINVDTDARLAMTGAIRQVLTQKPEEFDPRKYLTPARDAMRAVYEERMTQFGQAGHAGDYEPQTLEEMKNYYAVPR